MSSNSSFESLLIFEFIELRSVVCAFCLWESWLNAMCITYAVDPTSLLYICMYLHYLSWLLLLKGFICNVTLAPSSKWRNINKNTGHLSFLYGFALIGTKLAKKTSYIYSQHGWKNPCRFQEKLVMCWVTITTSSCFNWIYCVKLKGFAKYNNDIFVFEMLYLNLVTVYKDVCTVVHI